MRQLEDKIEGWPHLVAQVERAMQVLLGILLEHQVQPLLQGQLAQLLLRLADQRVVGWQVGVGVAQAVF
ncbi:hypothetical protein D3C76_1465180 [compost metagenome]